MPIEDVQLRVAEVKTGNARLNQQQKIIKQAVKNGQVSFKELRVKYCEDTEDMCIMLVRRSVFLFTPTFRYTVFIFFLRHFYYNDKGHSPTSRDRLKLLFYISIQPKKSLK